MSSAAYPPLTTPFVVPSTCFDQPKTAITNKPSAGDLEIDISFGTSCLPPNPQIQSWYSPGMCMADWTTVVSATGSNGQVVAACCPKDYKASSRSGQVCASEFSTTTTVRCLSDFSKSTLPSGTCQTTIVSSGVAALLPIFVAYQQKDLSLFPADYTPGQAVLAASTTSSASKSQSGQSSGFASPTSSSIPSASHSTLSTAAKIGIGLGVPLGVLLIAAVFLIGFVSGRRRRRRRRRAPEQLAAAENVQPAGERETIARSELDERPKVAPEIDSSAIYELHSPVADTEHTVFSHEEKT